MTASTRCVDEAVTQGEAPCMGKLPSRNPIPGGRGRFILAGHLIITGYGHWLPNDPRGSGSESVREDELKQLGDIRRVGRKCNPRVENSASSIRTQRLCWTRMRCGSTRGCASRLLTHFSTWSSNTDHCLGMRNHAHLVVRKHHGRRFVEIIQLGTPTVRRLPLRPGRDSREDQVRPGQSTQGKAAPAAPPVCRAIRRVKCA